MATRGHLIAFESASKCGKTTLAKLLADKLAANNPGNRIASERGALSRSAFAKKVAGENICDVAYSSSFYWADIVFHTADIIIPIMTGGGVVVQDRYDISIVAYREIHGLSKDHILLDEYLKRGMIIHPDLTVYLDPEPEIAFERIRNSQDSSPIDMQFLQNPSMFLFMQERIRNHIVRLGRNYLALDTGAYGQEECLTQILKRLETLK